MVSAMHNLTSRVFEHLDIPPPIELYQRFDYTNRILRWAALKKYKAVLLECNQLGKDLAGDK